MRTFILVPMLLGLWVSAATAQKKKLIDEPIDRPTAHTNLWCPSTAYISGSFVADGPQATLVFTAQIHKTFFPEQFMDGRIDNVTIVKRSDYDSHVAAADPDSFFCLPNPPNVFYFHDVPASDLVFQDTFAQAPNPGWDTTQGAFYVNTSVDAFEASAPNDLRSPSHDSGGSLGLGRATDTQPFATTNIVVGGLVAGVEYVLDFWWRSTSDDSVDEGYVRNGDLFVQVLGSAALRVAFDLKPQGCPNQINVRAGGVFPAAILGSSDLDVRDIDVASLRLLGSVAPVRSGLEDVGRPAASVAPCACPGGRDGRIDLTLKFRGPDIVSLLGPVTNGEVRELALTGTLRDGTPLTGSDCVVIGGAASSPVLASPSVDPIGLGRVRSVQYVLAGAAHVRLTVYDAAGRVVERLVDAVQPAGAQETAWDTSHISSGIYFLRLEVAGATSIAKTVVVR